MWRKTIRRNSKQEIRIRRQACPHGTLRSIGYAGKIAARVKQIENDLKMYMQHPATVLIRYSYARKFLPSRNALSNFQSIKCLRRQIAVQHEEFSDIIGFVPQNHQRSIV